MEIFFSKLLVYKQNLKTCGYRMRNSRNSRNKSNDFIIREKKNVIWWETSCHVRERNHHFRITRIKWQCEEKNNERFEIQVRVQEKKQELKKLWKSEDEILIVGPAACHCSCPDTHAVRPRLFKARADITICTVFSMHFNRFFLCLVISFKCFYMCKNI